MDAIDEFLAMGGHAAFIWPSFAVAAVVMVALLIVNLRGLRARQIDLKALQDAQRGASKAGGAGNEA